MVVTSSAVPVVLQPASDLPATITDDMIERCAWVPENDELYIAYHDTEWGVPIHDERRLFELLCLEGAQAGLSWRTILARRDGYRAAFEDFEPERLAGFDDERLEAILRDPRIIRNRLKVITARDNARALLALRPETTLSQFLWDVVGGRPIQNAWVESAEIPVSTTEAETMSRRLKSRGFRFVGATICYAFMQSAGLVNDHLASCFRYDEVARAPGASQSAAPATAANWSSAKLAE